MFVFVLDSIGEMLDQIEFQVKEASEYIDEANVNLVESIALQIGLRKKQCLCLFIGLVIAGAIGGIIYAFVKH